MTRLAAAKAERPASASPSPAPLPPGRVAGEFLALRVAGDRRDSTLRSPAWYCIPPAAVCRIGNCSTHVLRIPRRQRPTLAESCRCPGSWSLTRSLPRHASAGHVPAEPDRRAPAAPRPVHRQDATKTPPKRHRSRDVQALSWLQRGHCLRVRRRYGDWVGHPGRSPTNRQ